MKRILYLLPLLFLAATYGPPFSVSNFDSLTNRPNPSLTNPSALVLGKTNAYDGNGGIFIFDSSNTNAVDDDIYLPTTTTGRWVRLTRDVVSVASPLALVNGQLSFSDFTNYFSFLAGTNMQVTVTATNVTYAMTNLTGGGGGTFSWEGIEITDPNLKDTAYIYWVPSGSELRAYIVEDSVDYTRLPNVPQGYFLGRFSPSTGDTELLSFGANLSLNTNNGVLSATIGSGATNGTPLSVDSGSVLLEANLIDSPEIDPSVSGSNITLVIVASSIATNKINSAFLNLMLNQYRINNLTNWFLGITNSATVTWATNANGDWVATSAAGGSGSGETNTASNLGTSSVTNQGWYASKSGADLRFRSLTVGDNLTLTSNANDVVLNVNLAGGITNQWWFGPESPIDELGNNGDYYYQEENGGVWRKASGVYTLQSNFESIVGTNLAAASSTVRHLYAGKSLLDLQFRSIAAGTGVTLDTNATTLTINASGGSGTGTVVTANGGSDMSRANITTNGFGLLVTQSSTNIQISLTNNYPTDFYAGGFLPLFAGLSNSLYGNLHFKKSTDIRVPMWESGTEWNAMGYRAVNGAWGITEYNTNDFTVLETFVSVDPTDITGPTDYITFHNSGFNNVVVFDADVVFNGGVTGGDSSLFIWSMNNTNLPIVNWTNAPGYRMARVLTNVYLELDPALVRLGGIGLGTEGDIIYRDSAGWTNLARGTNGQILTATATGLVYSNAAAGGGSGDFVGPSSSTDNAIVRFDGTTGKLGQDSTVIISDTGDITGVTSINNRNYYSIENGDWWVEGGEWSVGFGLPYLKGGAIASGSLSSIVGTTNNPFAVTLASSTTTNSGYQFSSIVGLDIGGGGESTFVHSIAATNAVIGRWGFVDVVTTSESVDGAYFNLENGFVQGVIANNSSRTRSTTSNQVASASTTFYRWVVSVADDGSGATFAMLSPSGTGYTTNWTDTVTASVPTGSSARLTGIGIVMVNKDTPSAIALSVFDAAGMRNTRILTR